MKSKNPTTNRSSRLKPYHSNSFDYHQDFSKIDFRKNPHLYQVGKGEQGVLLCQPYKAEILPHWRFATPEKAEESSQKIFSMFQKYLEDKDFPGADMARKFLQMGFTRSRRYANHKGGRKFSKNPQKEENEKEAREKYVIDRVKEECQDQNKVESAKIFKEMWDKARKDEEYLKQKEEFIQKYKQ
eukprot:TRINITY_DN4054_c0_g1_i1.p1 TRINITY_DN4054_c0_g1~~TRINITY_DN4054_c0_g1_i1.p1  ORF type:complete len:185 (-),score=50.80 TRINITY_DN4054_c0_g1_i1:7-561(-)